MTEEKKVILDLDGVQYTEGDFNDEAKAIYPHLHRMVQKLESARMNYLEIERGKNAFLDDIRAALTKGPEVEEAEVVN